MSAFLNFILLAQFNSIQFWSIYYVHFELFRIREKFLPLFIILMADIDIMLLTFGSDFTCTCISNVLLYLLL